MEPRERLERKLAGVLLEDHPEDAAAELERLPAPVAAALLAEAPVDAAAGVLKRTVSHAGATILVDMPAGQGALVLAELSLDIAASLLRRLSEAHREHLLRELDEMRAAGLRSLLRYPEGTAGAVMDSGEIVLADDLVVMEAIDRVLKSPDQVHYNLFVVNREQTLVGVLNLHELFMAPQRERLRAIMKEPVHRLSAKTGLDSVVRHPGWRAVPTLPVVDDEGRFLGTIRYRALRRIEAQLEAGRARSNPTSQALADLYWTGIGGLFETLVSAAAPRRQVNLDQGSDRA